MTTLSELPEDVVDYIFSKMEYLTSKDVVRLSLVSKQFHSIVHRHPTLIFDDSSSHSDLQLNHMISTLERYKNDDIPLEKFTFRLSSEPYCSRRNHNRCIRLAAAQKGLKFLSLSMPKNKGYYMPRPVFRVKSLVELKLENCRMQLPDSDRIAWRNLRRLTLAAVHVHIGDGVLMNIMRSCPLIERLIIDENCTGDIRYDHLSASSNLGNLRDLRMLADDSITTSDFPRLENLVFSNVYRQTISISSPSLKRIMYYYEIEDIRPIHQIHFNAPNMVLFEFIWIWSNIIDFPDLSFIGYPSGCIPRISFLFIEEVCSLRALRMKEKLKKFSAALNSSEIGLVGLDLQDAIFERDEMEIFPCLEINIRTLRIISTDMKFSLSSATAILDGIFSICVPESVEFKHSNSLSDAVTSPPARMQHPVKFSASGHKEIIEVLKLHEEKDKFFLVFSKLKTNSHIPNEYCDMH